MNTTTQTFSGYTMDSRPTSRVMAPPGGRSSNIFGTDPVPQQPQRQAHPANENAPFATNSNAASWQAPPSKPMGAMHQSSFQTAHDASYQPAAQPQLSHSQAAAQRQQQSSVFAGSIAQAELAEKGSRPATFQPSSRVLQPPGGRSSNIFG